MRARTDLDLVKKVEIADASGQPQRVFADHCGFVPLASPDPESPPEWNLFNKDIQKAPRDPSRAYWSLQIMAFRANSLRKAAAVQAVAALRKQGIEAYYFHGEEISSVLCRCLAQDRDPRTGISQQQQDWSAR